MNSKELLGLLVHEVMTTDLIKVTGGTILKEVHQIFESENIHHVLVVDEDGKFSGIISKSDLFLLLDWGTKLKLEESQRRNNFLLTSNLASDVMQTNVITLKPEDSIRRCVQLFKENYFRALPVIDSYGYLVGIITTYDLMILAYNE